MSDSRRLSPNRDLRNLIELAQAQGWVVERRNNNHLKWTSPTGYVVWSASTPSDRRALRNIARYLKIKV